MRNRFGVPLVAFALLVVPLFTVKGALASSSYGFCEEKSSVVFTSMTVSTPKIFGKTYTVDASNPYPIQLPVQADPACATSPSVDCYYPCHLRAAVAAHSSVGGAGAKVRIQRVESLLGQATWTNVPGTERSCRRGKASSKNASCTSGNSDFYSFGGRFRAFCEWKKPPFEVDRGARIACEIGEVEWGA